MSNGLLLIFINKITQKQLNELARDFIFVLVSIAQLVWTMHNICKVRGSNLGHHQKKETSYLFKKFIIHPKNSNLSHHQKKETSYLFKKFIIHPKKIRGVKYLCNIAYCIHIRFKKLIYVIMCI
jgi:hypothetical protein